MNRSSSLLAVRIAATIAISAWTPGAAAETVRLVYEIQLGGFSAGAIELEATTGAAGYRVLAKTEGRGLVEFLTGFHSEARSEGALRGDAVQPLAHQADNRWRGDSRRVRIRYQASGAPQFEAEPPPQADDRDPVPGELAVGTLDPLSAALQATLAAQAGRGCEGRLEIFDGRRRYALQFRDRRQEAGQLRCQIGLERIAGMSHDPWLPIMRPIETADLWIASFRAGVPPVPVRLEAQTSFGAAIVQLTKLEGAPPRVQ